MLIKVISGGQNGADIAGVRAAKLSGFETGGMLPSGFRTLDGPRPEYAEQFGMFAHESWAYPPRTYQNVKDSDGTIRFAVKFDSAGEKCTLKAINQYDRPHFDVHIKDVNVFSLPAEEHPQAVAKWIIVKNITVLNVAGNSEHTAPGIEKWVERYISAMLKYVQQLAKGNPS